MKSEICDLDIIEISHERLDCGGDAQTNKRHHSQQYNEGNHDCLREWVDNTRCRLIGKGPKNENDDSANRIQGSECEELYRTFRGQSQTAAQYIH